MNHQQITGVAETASRVQDGGMVGVYMHHQGELAQVRFALALWTDGKTRVRVRVQQKIVAWALFPKLSPAACHSVSNPLNNSGGGRFPLAVFLIKRKRLFRLRLAKWVDQCMSERLL